MSTFFTIFSQALVSRAHVKYNTFMKQKEFKKGLLLRAIPTAVFLIATAISAALEAHILVIAIFLGLMLVSAVWGLYFISSNFQQHLTTFRREDLAKAVFSDTPHEQNKEEFFNKSYYNTFNSDTVRFVETGVVVNAESETPVKFSWDDLQDAEIDQIQNAAHLPQIKFTFVGDETHYIYFDMETYLFLQSVTGDRIKNFAELKESLMEFKD